MAHGKIVIDYSARAAGDFSTGTLENAEVVIGHGGRVFKDRHGQLGDVAEPEDIVKLLGWEDDG